VDAFKPSQFLLSRISETLEGRELDVVFLRLGVGGSAPLTLQEIGDRLGLTRERVRQIQHKALIKIGDPELNAVLLMGNLTKPDLKSLYSGRRKKTRNKNSEIFTKTLLKISGTEDQDLIIVNFHQPVKGLDRKTGDTFNSDRHTLHATWARVNGVLTEFLTDDEELVASWQTKQIKAIQWPTGRIVPATRNSYTERMEEIRSRYPNAWSKWSYEEDQVLVKEFSSGMSINDCCLKHGRARGGIVSRLRKLELIADDQSTVGL